MNDWARDEYGHSYCGECGGNLPDFLSSHHEDCTVLHAMREAMELTPGEWTLARQALEELAGTFDRKARSRGLAGTRFARLRANLREKRDEARNLAIKITERA